MPQQTAAVNSGRGPSGAPRAITDVIGNLPYRLALSGGWIDQPFLSQLDPAPPGSMVVVGVEPAFRFMDRCGLGTSTRKVAAALWPDGLPAEDPAALVRQLYATENEGRAEPSGSQDMIGLIYPGVSRLDYAYDYEGGLFPVHVETNCDPAVGRWLEQALYCVPVAPRPAGYSPLGVKNLDPQWIRRLGRSGLDCYDAIVARDLHGLGAAMNETMLCWQTILPHTVRHPTLTLDLLAILGYYQARYAGAMYSGCGGGYLYVAAQEPVPGGFHANIRLGEQYGEQSGPSGSK